MFVQNKQSVLSARSLICLAAAAASSTKQGQQVYGFGIWMQQSELLFVALHKVSESLESRILTCLQQPKNAELIYKTANLAAKLANYIGISIDCFEIQIGYLYYIGAILHR